MVLTLITILVLLVSTTYKIYVDAVNVLLYMTEFYMYDHQYKIRIILRIAIRHPQQRQTHTCN